MPGQSGPGSNGNEGVLHIPQSPSITGTSPSDCLVSYPGHSFWRVLPLCRGAVSVFYNPSQLGNNLACVTITPSEETLILFRECLWIGTAEEARRQLHCEQYWTSPGGNTPQGTNYTANCLPSRKLYKLDESDMQDTAGEARTNSSVMYSYGPLHMTKQKQDGQLEHTYSSYVMIRDVALKTSQKWWMIGEVAREGQGYLC